jgi:hypothetical protein
MQDNPPFALLPDCGQYSQTFEQGDIQTFVQFASLARTTVSRNE